MRGRAWRRAQTARLHARFFKRLLKQNIGSHHYEWCLNGKVIEYNRQNSVDETVIVLIRTPAEFEEYWRLRASLEMNNPKVCDCMWCHNARRRGFGNSRKKTHTLSERSFHSYAVSEIDLATQTHRPSNHSWRR